MTAQRTPSSQRLHIAFFGRRNAGKSSLINALSQQAVSLVSPVAGTTTDPVRRPMELHPLGPVVLIDTAGIDDEGELAGSGRRAAFRSWTRPTSPFWPSPPGRSRARPTRGWWRS